MPDAMSPDPERAKKRLMLAWFQAYPDQPMPEAARQVEELLAVIVEAHAAGYRVVADPPIDPSREELWKKFTGGEKLAYGCGFRDGRNAAAPTEEKRQHE